MQKLPPQPRVRGNRKSKIPVWAWLLELLLTIQMTTLGGCGARNYTVYQKDGKGKPRDSHFSLLPIFGRPLFGKYLISCLL